jgi:acetylglutamate kinase
VGILHRLGIRCVVVHGGGKEITGVAERLGFQPQFVDGRRVTDGATRDVAVMVLNGAVNTRVVAACREALVPAVGISGVDAGVLHARRRPPTECRQGNAVDYGYVGDVTGSDSTVPKLLIEGGYVPIISPLAADDDGTILNVNADVAAAHLAVALGAEKLIVLTGARGILRDKDDPASLVSFTDLDGLKGLDAEGALAEGMMPKAAAIRTAIEGGVPRVHVIGYSLEDSLLTEVFTNEGSGTMVVADSESA